MRSATLAPAFGLMLALAGCTASEAPPFEPPVDPPVDPMPPPMVETCGAEGLHHLLGQPEAVLATMRFAQVVRVIRPGMAVTMDYSPDRLNIEIDEAGRISRVSCG